MINSGDGLRKDLGECSSRASSFGGPVRRLGTRQALLVPSRGEAEVEIQIGRERQKASARILGPADPDYGRLWKIVDESNHERSSAYQEQTSRPIPIVVVTPG